MNGRETRREMADFYKKKWHAHCGFWIDIYKPHQQVYAASLNMCRNRYMLSAIPPTLDAVLDLGCGVGDVMLPLSQRARLVVGLDIGEVNVAMTRKNLQVAEIGNAHVLQGSAAQLPFEDGSFDTVIMADVIEHVPDIDFALAEMKRVLKPGGIGICVTPNASWLGFLGGLDGLVSRILRPGKHKKLKPTPVYERFLSKRDLEHALQKAGFGILHYRRICFYPGPEGSGVFTTFMSVAYRKLDQRVAEGLTRFFIRLFDLVEKLRIFNHKQMWVLRA